MQNWVSMRKTPLMDIRSVPKWMEKNKFSKSKQQNTLLCETFADEEAWETILYFLIK